MKKFLWLIGILTLCQIIAMEVSYLTSEEDKKAILLIVGNWIRGWTSCDAQLAVEGFAEDIEWMNSFGVKKKGSAETKKFLDWAFSFPNAKERNDSETVTLISFIRPEVALVYTDFHVERQRYLSGEEMADRDGHILRVLVKDQDKWQIVSMLMMDEKSSSYSGCD